jgi:phosphopantothenoylcysteine decarboxylase
MTEHNVLLGVTGSVAATLTPKMVEALTAIGPVQVVATESARYFFEHAAVVRYADRINYDHDEWWYGDLRTEGAKKWKKKGDPVVHIDLRDWADILVLAPLTANTMAKMCSGICDNLITSVTRAWDFQKPIVFAPAMNTLMWHNWATPIQVAMLQNLGAFLVPPISKELACGDEGEGAMARIEDIVAKAKEALRLMAFRQKVIEDSQSQST